MAGVAQRFRRCFSRDEDQGRAPVAGNPPSRLQTEPLSVFHQKQRREGRATPPPRMGQFRPVVNEKPYALTLFPPGSLRALAGMLTA